MKRIVALCLCMAVSAANARSDTPFAEDYRGYSPDFLNHIARQSGHRGALRNYPVSDAEMKLSSEQSFFSLNLIPESDRAYALVNAAQAAIAENRHSEAMEIYQQALEQHGDTLYRVSEHGVFVPVSEYVQRLMLRMPPSALALYRTKHDGRARDAFEQARRQRWLVGYADILGTLMATSYGAPSLFELGRAALDNGHYLQALEYFETIRRFFPATDIPGPELDLCIRLSRRRLGLPDEPAPKTADPYDSRERSEFVQAMRRALVAAKPDAERRREFRASAPHVATDDYGSFPPTQDPLALGEPVWSERLPRSENDYIVFSQPVVTEHSVIYRHKNILYARSILSGELRWLNDMGGRVVWQSPVERMYPLEDVVVMDGLVFSPMERGGPSLVALDEVTGQLRWAYGPMTAATEEESRMRFESVPAVGPGAVYAGYILNNVSGDTHTDTEYGLMAFESATGRVLWRTPVSRLRPGRFATSHHEQRNILVKSFATPPLYAYGAVYFTDNAGAIVSVDALSGRIRWLARYPYHPTVHDATRPFGGLNLRLNRWRPHSPMFWFNQRPMPLGDRIVFFPVNTRLMLCLDRRTGKTEWSRIHPDSYTFVLGPTSDGHLVQVASGRADQRTVTVIDPEDGGKTLWEAPPVILHDDSPVMKYQGLGRNRNLGGGINFAANQIFQGRPQLLGARPFLTEDDKLYISTWLDINPTGYYQPPWCYSLAEVCLKTRSVPRKRRYYDGRIRSSARTHIERSRKGLEEVLSWPKDKQNEQHVRILREVAADSPPENKHGPFLPFSRATFDRFGVRFELRFGAREVAMLYDSDKLEQALAARTDLQAEFAKAERAVFRGQYADAVRRLERCLAMASPEDLDFRTQVNQQLYGLHKRLARAALQGGSTKTMLAHGIGMSRSVTRLSEEIEALLVLAEVRERENRPEPAAQLLQNVVDVYGGHEYPVSALMATDPERSGLFLSEAGLVLERAARQGGGGFLAEALSRAFALEKAGLPVYRSALSPLEKTLNVRAGDWATGRLLRLRASSPAFSQTFEKAADQALRGRSAEEQEHAVRLYPGTRAAQDALSALLNQAAQREADPAAPPEARADARRKLWALADLARVGEFALPDPLHARLSAPPAPPAPPAVRTDGKDQSFDLDEERSPAWLIAPRRDGGQVAPDLLFLAGRVRTRVDHKFLLAAWDLTSGTKLWNATEQRGDTWFDEIRLDGLGDEPGFHDVYVHGDVAVVHGLFDVLAFGLADGKLRWRWRVPHDFRIRHALYSGDLAFYQGETETVALYLPTDDPRGEIVWQQREAGDPYAPAWLVGDRLVSVRRMPFNVTARYRGTGRLIGRLELPDLSTEDAHPLLDDGPRALPVAHDGARLALTDGWYYLMVDTDELRIVWKRLVDANDPAQDPKMRLTLNDNRLAVLKEDFDKKAMYMLDSGTGEILWPREGVRGAAPMYSTFLRDGILYGLRPHRGQGYFLAAVHADSGKPAFKQQEKTGYGGVPDAALLPRLYGNHLAVAVRDRQSYEINVFGARDGKPVRVLQTEGVGEFGAHGGASFTIQNGRPAILGRHNLVLGTPAP